MALIFCDSFDDRPYTAIGDRYASGGASGIAAGRTGNAARITTGILDAFEHLTYEFSSRQSVYVGVARNVHLNSSLCSIRYNGTPHLFPRMNDDGTITVWLFGAPSTALWTSSQTVTPGEWFYVELYGKIDTADGAWELRIDGQRWGSQNGINTSSTGDSLANQVRLTFDHAGGPDDAPTYVDDFYIADDDADGGNALIVGFAGPVKIACRNPNGAGASSEWTPLSGANYTNVDETTGKDEDTSYVASLTDGAVDLYAHQALEVINPTIVAVAVHQWAKKMDATSRTIAPVAYVGSVEYPGDEVALDTDYGRVFHAFEKNPATGAAWTRAQVSSAQFGAMLGS